MDDLPVARYLDEPASATGVGKNVVRNLIERVDRAGLAARHGGQDEAQEEPDYANDQKYLANGLDVDRANLAQVDGVGDDRPEGDHE